MFFIFRFLLVFFSRIAFVCLGVNQAVHHGLGEHERNAAKRGTRGACEIHRAEGGCDFEGDPRLAAEAVQTNRMFRTKVL